jgi:ferrous iron transport protein B
MVELAPAVVVALNQVDLAASRGLRVDADRLSARLGVPVVPTVARSGAGVEGLLDVLVHVAAGSHRVAG